VVEDKEISMTQELNGTVALVTGASSGIGAATARALAARGAAVAAVARRKDRLDELVAQIERAGGTALAIEADITDRRQAEAAVDQAVDGLGRLDVLVNNAGLMLLGNTIGADPSGWERMINVNVLGLLYTTNAAMPHLLQAAESQPRRVADIVNIGSVAGRSFNAFNGVYALTKAGVAAFTESLRQEVTGRHVRVSLVEPGAVESELISHNTAEIQPLLTPTYQPLSAEDQADAIAYMVTLPRHAAVADLWFMPTEQV
jgi:NADP-dependent 3-hydroxy acid dehydrogenase YdfG